MDYIRIAFRADGTAQSMQKFENHLPALVPMSYITTDEDIHDAGLMDMGRLRGVIEGGQVTAVEIMPAGPAPEQVDLLVEIEALKAVVAGNALASEHDRRWLKIKTAAKDFGIPWIRANPTATSEDVVAALALELRADPALATDAAVQASVEHIVRWLLATYAATAQTRGYIPEASFEALRALVVGATDKQIKQMLRVL